MDDKAQWLLTQLLTASSDEDRRHLLEAYGDTWLSFLAEWGQAAWQASKAGEHEQALAIQSLLIRIFAAAGAQKTLALAQVNYGHLLNAAGRQEAARQSWQQGWESFGEPPSNRSRRADSALNLGTSYWQSGDYPAAVHWLETALKDYGQLPPSLSAAFARTRLGDSQQALGQWAEALQSYEHARQLFVDLGQQALAADRQADIGMTQQAAGRIEEAVQSLQEAVRSAQASGDADCHYRLLEKLGYLQQHSLQDYKAALETFRCAIAVARQPADSAAAHVLAAGVCETLARWDEAVEHYQQAATASSEAQDRLAQAGAREGLARVQQQQGDYEHAQQAYEQALNLYNQGREECRKRWGSWPEGVNPAIRIHSETGQLDWTRGHPEGALQHYQQALALAEADSNWDWAGFIAATLGSLYETALNQPHQAHQWSLRAAEYYERLDTAEGRLQAYQQRGAVLLAEGAAPQAEQCYRQAIATAQQVEDRLATADNYRRLAQAQVTGKKYTAARWSQYQAIRLYRRLDLPLQKAQAYVDLAGLHQAFDQPVRAAQAYRSAIRIYQSADDPTGAAMIQISLAQLYFIQGRYDSARQLLTQALTTLESTPAKAFSADYTALLGLGAVQERLGQPWQALSCYRRAINEIEQDRADLIHPEFKLSVLGERQNVYARAIVLSVQTDQPGEALVLAESSRSRSFLDLLALTPLLSPAQMPPELLAREQEWLGRLRGLLTKRQAPGTLSATDWAEVHSAWQHLQEVWTAMSTVLGSMEYLALRHGSPVTLAELKQCLESAPVIRNPLCQDSCRLTPDA